MAVFKPLRDPALDSERSVLSSQPSENVFSPQQRTQSEQRFKLKNSCPLTALRARLCLLVPVRCKWVARSFLRHFFFSQSFYDLGVILGAPQFTILAWITMQKQLRDKFPSSGLSYCLLLFFSLIPYYFFIFHIFS